MPEHAVRFQGFDITDDASLAGHNSLRVAARARFLAHLHDAARLPDLLDLPAVRAGPTLVLGEGSNVLFAGDYPGTVIAMATRGIVVEEDADAVHLTVAAGERWDDFVRFTLGRGFAGLENLILIPGTVGAAPIQNIGAYGVEVSRFLESVQAYDPDARRFVTFDRAACAFGYRDSIFKHEAARCIVTSVRFVLPRASRPVLEYSGIAAELAAMGVNDATPDHIAEAVVRLRTRKLPDPAEIGNAGSFFKNPIVTHDRAARLKREHPALPVWPAGERSKLSAAWMIEACGLKGLREGDAGISSRHALVLVNHGHATGAELWALAQRVIARVAAGFEVVLESEPRVIGAP